MIAYSRKFPDGLDQWAIELECFYLGWGEEQGGLGRFEHLRNAIDLIWNKNRSFFIWNEWTEMMLRGFCEEREVSLSGPGASWKTTCMAIYAVCFWLCSPMDTRVIITSTTLDGLRSRIWKEVMHFYRTSNINFGNAVNHPHPKIQSTKGDDGSGIFGIAVEAGDIEKAVNNIQGRHAPNTLVEVDEMTGVSEAIVRAGSNLEKGTRRFQMLGSANPESNFDQHGLFSEPEDGWLSITVESEKWRTKRGGIGIHLDGLKSPNVLLGRKRYPGLINHEDIELSKKRDGENSPDYWKFVRGFWCPEGLSKKILSESVIAKFNARDKPIWIDTPINVAAFDPAFEGGDRRVLGFGKVGKIMVNDKPHTILSLEEVKLLKVDVTQVGEPLHYQLTRQVKEELSGWEVPPEYFAMDVSGEGGGIASILKREWSEDFLEVEFGGGASDRRISDIDIRTGKERYVNRVSELWYNVRAAVERNQIRGLNLDACKEFCQRFYDMRGARIVAESKTDMKARTGFSPDIADMFVVMLELVLDRGMLETGLTTQRESKRNKNWIQFALDMVPLNEYASTQ